MNWRLVAASVVGTSHAVSGGSCQDSCLALVEICPKRSVLSIFVADGAGSAVCGGRGAELAVEAAAAFLAQKCTLPDFVMNDDLAVELVLAVREIIYAKAAKKGVKARDYACTFLGVLSSSEGTLVMQIGDGGIVLDVGEGLHVPVAPMSGEYANMTHFVTDEDAVDVLVTKVFLERASKVAVFSDGIQRLALNMATNTAYEPFFAPFFRALATATPDEEDDLYSALVGFLSCSSVNERTDDDKTLALAVSVE